MPINVDGVAYTTLTEAIEACRIAWSKNKAEAVLEQLRVTLAKPSQLDRERAKLGVTPNVSAS